MTTLLLLKLASAFVSVALAAGILARDHRLLSNRLIAAYLLCNAWWALGEFALFQTVDATAAMSIFRWTTIGWLPLGVLCLHASLTLSSMEHHPVGRLIVPLYVAVAIVAPIAIGTDFVMAGAEPRSVGWRPIFGPGMAFAYLLVALPSLATLVCWRRVMTSHENSGQRQLARVVFFGLGGALVAGTTTAIVLPLFGIAALGITTTLVALVGSACAWTLHRYGHSLISNRALAREILDTLDDAVILVGEGGVLRDANRAFVEMIGVSGARVIGTPVERWIPGFSERTSSEGASVLLEVRSADGEHIPVVASAPVALSESSRSVGEAFLLRDQREIVALQRRLIVSARLAAVGDLSKSISRSIDEPVTRALESLEGLSSDWEAIAQLQCEAKKTSECEEASEEGRELIDECIEGIERISSIVREISGFSPNPSRKRFTRQSLSDLVARAVRIAQANASPGIEIEHHLDTDVQIECFAPDIERVVTNLLVNAIQALEARSESDPHLVVAVGAQGHRALIHVEDDGCGIEADVLDRIFDPFFTTKPVGKGTGLGLAISYHIVKDHGGDIRVSSIPGRGTSVTVQLPRVAAA
jgi:PAS domain S-box-containing protein